MFIVVGPNSSFPFIKKRHTFAQLLNLSPERGARWVESERTPADGPPIYFTPAHDTCGEDDVLRAATRSRSQMTHAEAGAGTVIKLRPRSRPRRMRATASCDTSWDLPPGTPRLDRPARYLACGSGSRLCPPRPNPRW